MAVIGGHQPCLSAWPHSRNVQGAVVSLPRLPYEALYADLFESSRSDDLGSPCFQQPCGIGCPDWLAEVIERASRGDRPRGGSLGGGPRGCWGWPLEPSGAPFRVGAASPRAIRTPGSAHPANHPAFVPRRWSIPRFPDPEWQVLCFVQAVRFLVDLAGPAVDPQTPPGGCSDGPTLDTFVEARAAGIAGSACGKQRDGPERVTTDQRWGRRN